MKLTSFEKYSSNSRIENIIKKSSLLWANASIVNEEIPKLIGPAGTLRYIFQNFNVNNLEKCNRDFLINAIDNANKTVAGSGYLIPLLYNKKSKIENYNRFNSKKIINYLSRYITHDRIKNIINNIPIVAGSSAKIYVTNWKGNKDIMEYRSGVFFPIRVDDKFIGMTGEFEFCFGESDTLIIEGSPSSVSEINKLLESYAESKRPLILICRSFSEDIIATLATNWKRKSLNIIPMLYGDSIETINLPADFTSVTGGLPISKSVGDIISSINLEERTGSINSIKINNKGISFTSNISNNLNKQILNLIKKMNKEKNNDKQKIYADRISNLSAEVLEIKLKDDINYHILKEEIDFAISFYNQACISGIVKINIENKIYYFPKEFYKIALSHVETLQKTFKSIGGYVLET